MDTQIKNIVLIGGGGHCRSCIEVINSTKHYNILGILDLPSEIDKEVMGVKVVGTDSDIEKYHLRGCTFLITIGQIKSAKIRMKIFDELNTIGAKIETIIASTAYVSSTAQIGIGSIVMHNAFVNASVKIGFNNIINTGSIIEHDVKIGNHNHISTNTVINGDCTIGNENLVGSNACISNGINIGNTNIIGAGSLIINDIVEQGTYVGVPIKKLNNE